MTSILLQQAHVLDPVNQMDQVMDVLITEGTIVALAPTLTDIPTDTQIRDCRGLILAPGLVDCYSHSGEPGRESRETLESLQRAAIAGGFTRVALLPDTKPTIDHPAVIAQIQGNRFQVSGFRFQASESHRFQVSGFRFQAPDQNRFQVSGFRFQASDQTPDTSHLAPDTSHLAPDTWHLTPATCSLHLWGALTLNTAGEQMTELGELAAAGVVGFADGAPIANLALVQRLLEYAQPLGKPVALAACDRALAGNGVLREGLDALRLGLPIVPAAAETTALAAILELVATTDTPVHLMRISTARGVELIRAAKDRGLPITASTTWMHLLLSTSDVASYDPSLRLEPPLGTPADQAALLAAVQSGIIDAIAVDHNPHTYEDKTVPFAEAPPGAIGLELALPLLWQTLVAPGHWSALDLWQALSTRPAHCLGQDAATIAPGHPAEVILFDPHHTWQVTPTTLQSLSSNTPWQGKMVTGRVTIGY